MKLKTEIQNKKKQSELEKEKLSRLDKAFSTMLNTEQGKIFIKYILDFVPIDENCFSSDALQMSYLLGRHSIGVELRNYIKCRFGQSILQSIENEEI